MSENIILGSITLAVCLAIQCFVVALLLRFLAAMEIRRVVKPTLVFTTTLLVAFMLIMLAGNLLQITLWAGLFFLYGEFADFSVAFYHSVVNFSTLGYGDLVMSEQRRLLGALEAVNGVLMFGLTTGFLYTMLSLLMRRGWDRLLVKLAESGRLPPDE